MTVNMLRHDCWGLNRGSSTQRAVWLWIGHVFTSIQNIYNHLEIEAAKQRVLIRHGGNYLGNEQDSNATSCVTVDQRSA